MEAGILNDWRRLSSSRTQRCAVAMAGLTALFTLRVIAQALQFLQPSRLLPPFEAFQDHALPYAVLLPIQLVLVVVMSHATLAVAHGYPARDAVLGRRLRLIGTAYGAIQLLRLGIGLSIVSAPAWFHAWIPLACHLVLASFVLVLAAFHLRRC